MIDIVKCDVCGAENTIGLVASSAFGATSYAYCACCLVENKEPYRAIVNYISAAGRWPEDINPMYQREVRRQLRLHDKPEEIFKFDVDRAIAEEQAFIKEYCNNKLDLKEVMSEEALNEFKNLFS
jgi:hypothetical protein